MASRHNRAHFDIWTSKSGPRPSVFNTLDFEIASRHNGVHFFDVSTSKSAPMLKFLYILTWKRASRHNGGHVFNIST